MPDLQMILPLESFVTHSTQVLSLIRVSQAMLGQSTDIVELFCTNWTLHAAFPWWSHSTLTLRLWLLLLLLLLLLLQWLLAFPASIVAAFVGWLHFIYGGICVKNTMINLLLWDFVSIITKTKKTGENCKWVPMYTAVPLYTLYPSLLPA